EKQTRPIRRFADWWETTAIEKFFEDIDYLLKNLAILDVVSLLANVTLIVSLVSWFTERKERKEEKHFSLWHNKEIRFYLSPLFLGTIILFLI
ncbi:MAG: hypothetical protein AB4063_03455, partial [Crocosphaera sp.]